MLDSQSGRPSISMSAGIAGDGLPVGIILLGKAFTDERLVALANAFEQSGSMPLSYADRVAFAQGQLSVARFSTGSATPVAVTVR